MGLDQFAYAATRAGQCKGAWEDSSVPEPIKIAYWRKHPNLQGWMEHLWIEKGYPGLPAGSNKFDHTFNGVELELVHDDIDKLEQDIQNGAVAELGTKGFFFGNPSDEYYREHDLKFVREARANLFLGLRVFYNSSW